MINLRLLFIISFILFHIQVQLFSQDTKIAYIIPDVGTPGFGVYVEIISPKDSFGNFGPDTLYPNNNGKVRIVFDRPEDSNKVIVGPLVVSWQGRLLSTYFFVNPNIRTPNSSDWTLLEDEFRIALRVSVDGNLSNPDTFYIVKPYSFGNLVQNNQIFGFGQLGRRSPSGAIIVDNLNLSNLDYKAFLDNSPAFPQRNRSYLPFILLASGNVVGIGSNTRINVSAGEGRLQNGGPGGGGGGGRFCDYLTGNPGEDGGNGFTAGGKGGVNYFLSGNGAYKNLGTGTGDSGKSINGVMPPANPGGWEASGGGTGHPFGSSGIGSGDQSNWNYPGGYGGGTGSINNRMGGSGGFATDGQSEPSSYVNGGKTHGNPMIVPIAGGSGGASGNPSGLNVCSGSGGGGGGAIRIFAKRIENLSILANGANGGQSSNGAGGGGSGGSISVCAKEIAQNLNLFAQGGNGGGRGYFRVDAPQFANITYSHNNPPVYFGISTDTHSYAKRKFTLSGSKNPSSDNVLIYIKSSSTDWYLLKTVNGFANQTFWNTEIVLPDTSKVFYLCAIQDLNYSLVDTFKYQPRFLQSQAAMNIIQRIPQGICSGTQQMNLSIFDCPGKVVIDSGIIKNIGDGDLNLFFSRAKFKNNVGFELLSPRNDITLGAKDSIKFYVRYIANGNSTFTTLIDSLYIEHSDDEWSQNPWGIEVRIKIHPYNFDFVSIDKQRTIDTLNLGLICDNKYIDTNFSILNRSVFPIKFKYSYNPDNFSLYFNETPLGSSFADTLLLSLFPNQFGLVIDSIIAFPEDCPELKRILFIKYFKVNTNTEFVYSGKVVDTVFLGDICVGDSVETSFFVVNRSNYTLKIEKVSRVTNGNFQFLISQLDYIGINQNLENKVICVPRTEGIHYALLEYYFDQCGHKDTVVILYNGVKSNSVVLSGSYFGFVQVGESDTSEIIVVNKGTGTSYFDQEPPSFPNFEFLGSHPDLPTYLRPGDTLKLKYRFTPNNEGEFKSFVEWISNSNNDCPDTIRFELRGFGTNARIFANVDSVYLGLFPYCKSKDTIIYIYNKGTTDLIIRKVEIQQVYIPEHFVLSNSISKNVIPPNSMDSCVVKFVGVKGAPAGLKNALLIIESNDINNPQVQIKLSAFQENLNVDLVPDTINFGICQIGDSKTQRLKLINNGIYYEPQRIKDFEGNKFVFEPQPSVAVIYPGDSAEIVFTFRPDREGEIFDSMRIVYFQPCPDTQWVYLRGWGTLGSFFVTDTIDFGDVIICSNDTVTFEITNLGTIPFRIDSSKIIGPDANNFWLISVLPQIVDTVKGFQVVFGNADSEREFIAYLRLYIFINNNTRQTDIVLRAKPKRFVNFELIEIDFGNVPIGITKDSSFAIINYGLQSLMLDYFFASNTSVFSSNLQRNYPLPINSNPSFLISFTPNREGIFEDTLAAIIQYPDCLDTIKLTLKGYGVPPQDVIIIVPDVVFDPKNQQGNLPIYIRLMDTTKNIKTGGLEFKISFYWGLFHVLNAIGGKIQSDRIINQFREITLHFDSVFIDGSERKLVELQGVPLISDTDFSLVAIFDCKWLQPEYIRNTILDSGSIRIQICSEGGKRLVKPSFEFHAFLNSDNDILQIILKPSTLGEYNIKLFNVLGSLLFEKTVVVENLNDPEFKIPFYSLPNGLYLIQISNSIERKTGKVIHY